MGSILVGGGVSSAAHTAHPSSAIAAEENLGIAIPTWLRICNDA
jgi:hypothetical protein